MEVSLAAVKVRSTTETVGVGTRKDMPVSLPLVAGSTSPTALAAPVVEGMILMAAALPPLQSFFRGTVNGFLGCCIGMDGSHQSGFNADAFLQKHVNQRRQAVGGAGSVGNDVVKSRIIFLLIDSHTMVFTSPFPGAEMMTFFAPASRWPLAFSESVNNPVDSMTYSTPSSFHGS
jgi:hypothetical protein